MITKHSTQKYRQSLRKAVKPIDYKDRFAKAKIFASEPPIPKHFQAIDKALRVTPYRRTFSDYGYDFGAFDGGCLMVAKAIQNVIGGDLQYVARCGYYGLPGIDTLLHVVVEPSEDDFLDGSGYKTIGQLERAWRHFEPREYQRLGILPLSDVLEHLYYNEEAVAHLTEEIKKQLHLIELGKIEES